MSTVKGTHVPDAPGVQTCGHLLLIPIHKAPLLSRGHSLMSGTCFPGCLLASLCHMGITQTSHWPRGGMIFWQPWEREAQTGRYLRGCTFPPSICSLHDHCEGTQCSPYPRPLTSVDYCNQHPALCSPASRPSLALQGHCIRSTKGSSWVDGV